MRPVPDPLGERPRRERKTQACCCGPPRTAGSSRARSHRPPPTAPRGRATSRTVPSCTRRGTVPPRRPRARTRRGPPPRTTRAPAAARSLVAGPPRPATASSIPSNATNSISVAALTCSPSVWRPPVPGGAHHADRTRAIRRPVGQLRRCPGDTIPEVRHRVETGRHPDIPDGPEVRGEGDAVVDVEQRPRAGEAPSPGERNTGVDRARPAWRGVRRRNR